MNINDFYNNRNNDSFIHISTDILLSHFCLVYWFKLALYFHLPLKKLKFRVFNSFYYSFPFILICFFHILITLNSLQGILDF